MNAKIGIKSMCGGQEHLIHLEVALDTSVSVLKQRIQEEHVGSPPVTAQRLIYCGKIINNDATLGQVLSKMDLEVEQRFHLILSKDFTDKMPKPEPKVTTARLVCIVNAQHVVRLSVPLTTTTSELKTLLRTQLPSIAAKYWRFDKETQEDMQLSEFMPNLDLSRESTLIATTSNIERKTSNDTTSSTGSSVDQFAIDPQQWNTTAFQQQMAYYYYQQAMLANPEWAAQHHEAQMQAYQAQMASMMTNRPNNPSPFHAPMYPPAPRAPAERPNAPAPAAVAPPGQDFIERLEAYVDIKLAVRLILMVVIIGQDSQPEKFRAMVGAALLCYCYMTGLLMRMFNALRPYVTRSTPPPQQQQQAPNQPNAPPAAATHTRGYAPIAADGGFGTDVQYFVSGFFLSLLPTWSPTGQTV